MKLSVGKDYEESSRIAADLFEEVIRNKRDGLLGCATAALPLACIAA